MTNKTGDGSAIRKLFWIKAAAFWLALISGDATLAQTAAQQLTPVTIQVMYTPSGPMIPLAYGVQSGIFKSHGLDVTVRLLGATNLDPNLLVSNGQGEFAMGDAGSFLALHSQGVPLVSVMGLIMGNANAVIVRENANIKTAADLKGKTVAVIQNTGSQFLLGPWLKAHNVDPADVKIIPMSAAAKNQAFLAGTVDASTGYGEVIRPIYSSQGVPVTVLPYSDKIPFIQSSLVTRQSYAKDSPDVVHRFVKAFAESYVAAEARPAAAAKAAFDMSNGTGSPVPVLEQQLRGILPFTSTKRSASHPLGWMSEEDWKDTIALAKQFMSLRGDVVASKVFTNEFVKDNPPTPAFAYRADQ